MKRRKSRRVSAQRAKKRQARGFARSALIVLAVASGLFAVGSLDRDGGVRHLFASMREFASASKRMSESEARAASYEAEAAALQADPVAIEAAIRSDLGLARPGEWVVREEGGPSLRNP